VSSGLCIPGLAIIFVWKGLSTMDPEKDGKAAMAISTGHPILHLKLLKKIQLKFKIITLT